MTSWAFQSLNESHTAQYTKMEASELKLPN